MEAQYAVRRLFSSHPDYAEMNQLQTMLCHAYNPHLICHDSEWMDIEPLLITPLVNALKTALGELMDEGNFRDFVASWVYACE